VSVKNVTPEEAWSGIKPYVHHFRVFGCLAYAHVPDNHRKKLDSKSIKCVHLGLSEESKAYKLYDPIEKKIIISRDVVFDELHGWDWDNKDKKRTDKTTIEDVSDDELTGNTQQGDIDGQEGNESTDAKDHNEDSNEDNDDEQLPPRARRIPGHLRDFVLDNEAAEDQELHNYVVYSNCEDPNSYDEAAKSEVWRSAMDSEIDSIEKNNTWELTTLPEGSKAIGVKWIYKTKFNEMGKIEKYKARLVAKG
jgi:hypothetical protein